MAHLPFQRERTRRPASRVALGLLAIIWFVVAQELAARSATGFAGRLQGGMFVPLLRPLFLLFLLLLGLLLLDSFRGQASSVRELLALPRRFTSRTEWAVGAAIGWGTVLLAVIPLVLTRRLSLQFWLQPRAWVIAVVSIPAALLSSLAIELVFRGYAYRGFREVMGTAWTSVLLAMLYAVLVGVQAGGLTTIGVAFLFALLLSTGWLRTHGLWLPWGLHFGWNCALGLLFGLPALDGGDLSSLVQAQLSGQSALTGFGLGPIGAPWTLLLVLLAFLPLFRLTRDYAWQYTHAPIVPGGYPMEVAPSKAHQEMEAAAPPPPLVQILPSTPTDRSSKDA